MASCSSDPAAQLYSSTPIAESLAESEVEEVSPALTMEETTTESIATD